MENVKTKRSNLVMPTHYQELTREEMEYVDGGGTIYTWVVSGALDLMFLAMGATTAWTGVKLIGRTFGKKLAKKLCGSLSGATVRLVSVLCTGAGFALNNLIGKIGTALVDYFWSFSSVGALVAFVLDIAIDNKLDGVIYSW